MRGHEWIHVHGSEVDWNQHGAFATAAINSVVMENQFIFSLEPIFLDQKEKLTKPPIVDGCAKNQVAISKWFVNAS